MALGERCMMNSMELHPGGMKETGAVLPLVVDHTRQNIVYRQAGP
jgi:hypothetical protein